jgi:hypothetical protein
MTSTRTLRWVIGGSVLAVVAAVILVMAVRLTQSSSTDITDLDVGDCFQLDPDDDGSLDLVDVIDCGDPHDAEVVAIDDLNPGGDQPYPDDDALFGLADARCATLPDDPRFGIVAIAPTETSWEARRGRMVCVAVPYGGGQATDAYDPTFDPASATADV